MAPSFQNNNMVARRLGRLLCFVSIRFAVAAQGKSRQAKSPFDQTTPLPLMKLKKNF
jgi:hypothetical protein